MEARLAQSIRRASGSQQSGRAQSACSGLGGSLEAEGRSEEGGHRTCETARAPGPQIPLKRNCHIRIGWASLKPWRTQAKRCEAMRSGSHAAPCRAQSLPPAGHVGLPALAAELAVVARKAGQARSHRGRGQHLEFCRCTRSTNSLARRSWQLEATVSYRTLLKQQTSSCAPHSTALEVSRFFNCQENRDYFVDFNQQAGYSSRWPMVLTHIFRSPRRSGVASLRIGRLFADWECHIEEHDAAAPEGRGRGARARVRMEQPFRKIHRIWQSFVSLPRPWPDTPKRQRFGLLG